MRISLLSFYLFFFVGSVAAQLEADPTLASYYSQQFDSSFVKKHLTILASDSLEGRETGTEGLLKAAQYVRDQLKSWDLKAVDPAHSFYPARLRPLLFRIHRARWSAH